MATALPRSLQARYNQRTGAAAEEAFMRELTRVFPTAALWRYGGNASARFNKDIWGFDVLGITEHQLICAQVKATATKPHLDHAWLTRYLAWPRPANTLCLLAWLTPTGTWQTWRIERDGSLTDLEW